MNYIHYNKLMAHSKMWITYTTTNWGPTVRCELHTYTTTSWWPTEMWIIYIHYNKLRAHSKMWITHLLAESFLIAVEIRHFLAVCRTNYIGIQMVRPSANVKITLPYYPPKYVVCTWWLTGPSSVRFGWSCHFFAGHRPLVISAPAYQS